MDKKECRIKAFLKNERLYMVFNVLYVLAAAGPALTAAKSESVSAAAKQKYYPDATAAAEAAAVTAFSAESESIAAAAAKK